MKRLTAITCLVSWIVSTGNVSHACGPFFSETILDMSSAILRGPKTSFDFEMSRMANIAPPLPGDLKLPGELQPFRANGKPAKGVVASLFSLSGADLIADKNNCRTNLLASNSELTRDVAEVALFLEDGAQVEEYRALRTAMLPDTRWAKNNLPAPEYQAALKRIAKRDWPDYLPKEYRFYLDGAVHYSNRQWDAASKSFGKVLDLPLEERRYRSVWAAYMRGRTELKRGDVDLENSIAHFQQVLKERETGCHDSLDMGWEALRIVADHLELSGGSGNDVLRYRFAVAWYGKGPVSPILDFRRWTRKLVTDGRAEQIGRDDAFARRIFTATAIASCKSVRHWQDDNSQPNRWLQFLKTVELSNEELPSHAHFAYLSGDLDFAEQCLEKYQGASGLAFWLRGKLLAKKGQVRQARQVIAKAEPEHERALTAKISFHGRREGTRWHSDLDWIEEIRTAQYWGERGILALANDHYEEALDALLRSGHWRDTAYVAEQLLSREELLVYVRERWPSHQSSVDDEENPHPYLLRYLTARRLARDRYFKDARQLYPPELLPVFDRYVENYRIFRGRRNPEEERAKSGWEVAQIHRKLGMELFGTEVGPDYTCWSGSFGGSYFYVAQARLKQPWHSRIADKVNHYRNPTPQKRHDLSSWEQNRMKMPIFPQPTPAEQWRYRHYAKLPNAYRFHYRHVAADLAWEAAQLMPSESDETAAVLNIAGSWLAVRHPNAADVFYKSLVRRNRSTATGQLADERRWFVDHDWRKDFDPWPSEFSDAPSRQNFRVPQEFLDRATGHDF